MNVFRIGRRTLVLFEIHQARRSVLVCRNQLVVRSIGTDSLKTEGNSPTVDLKSGFYEAETLRLSSLQLARITTHSRRVLTNPIHLAVKSANRTGDTLATCLRGA